MVLLKNDKGLPLKEGAKVSFTWRGFRGFCLWGRWFRLGGYIFGIKSERGDGKIDLKSMRHFGTFTTKEQEKITESVPDRTGGGRVFGGRSSCGCLHG